MFSVLPDSITDVLFSSADRRLYAYRWSQGKPFQIMTASRASVSPEHCMGGPGFEQFLRTISTIKIIRASEKPFDTSSSNWADIELKDTTVLDPITMRIRVPEISGEPVVVLVDAQQFAVDVDSSILSMVKSGCGKFQN
jgi:hypothetical protein